MLDEIHKEKWSELEVSNGPAEHVPEAILGLLSSNEEQFDQAYWLLDNHIVVQSDLYSSAAVVPKYLEEIFVRSIYRERILNLLYEIGSGFSHDRELMETCKSEVTTVLQNLKCHIEIENTHDAVMIERLLRDLNGQT